MSQLTAGHLEVIPDLQPKVRFNLKECNIFITPEAFEDLVPDTDPDNDVEDPELDVIDPDTVPDTDSHYSEFALGPLSLTRGS